MGFWCGIRCELSEPLHARNMWVPVMGSEQQEPLCARLGKQTKWAIACARGKPAGRPRIKGTKCPEILVGQNATLSGRMQQNATLLSKVWNYPTICYIIRQNLTLPDKIWHFLTKSDITWQNLTLPDITCQNLTLPDKMWRYLRKSNITWQNVTLSRTAPEHKRKLKGWHFNNK